MSGAGYLNFSPQVIRRLRQLGTDRTEALTLLSNPPQTITMDDGDQLLVTVLTASKRLLTFTVSGWHDGKYDVIWVREANMFEQHRYYEERR